MPYDFRINANDTDLGDYDPSIPFNATPGRLLQYDSSSTGREDRIARVIDLPTHEITHVGMLRALLFKEFHANAVGNSWGDRVNRLYDRYFFSSLPVRNTATGSGDTDWDGTPALANARIRKHGTQRIPSAINSAEHLLIHNGFNLNSTSVEAWKSILSGRQFGTDSFEYRYEKRHGSQRQATVSEQLNHVFFNHPHSAVYNNTESSKQARYSMITLQQSSDPTLTKNA